MAEERLLQMNSQLIHCHNALENRIEQLNVSSLQSLVEYLRISLNVEANTSNLQVSNLYDKVQKLNTSLQFQLEVGDTELKERLQQIGDAISIRIEQLNISSMQSHSAITQDIAISIQGYLALDSRIEQLNVSSRQSHSAIGIQTQELNNAIIAINSSLRTGLDDNNPASSCAALSSFFPSDYYWVRASSGSMHVYCDMTRSCGGVTGGWMRVAYLDMTNSTHRCPSTLRQRTDSEKLTCRKNGDSAGCSSFIFPSMNVSYSKVCGRIIGYQSGSPDAFALRNSPSINSNYVDGISLTHGNPRQHIWTFAAGNDEDFDVLACPCLTNAAASPLPYIGRNYFCETGISGTSTSSMNLVAFWGDPLWDGAGCGDRDRCCSFNTPPWFYRQLSPTTDGIEMRVCRDEDVNNEDITIQLVELYIQ